MYLLLPCYSQSFLFKLRIPQVNSIVIRAPSPNHASTIAMTHSKVSALGVSRMGICVQKYIKYLKCHSFSGNFFREKNEKDRCGGTQERNQMFENKERAEKQLLTVNSVNPSCSSTLKLYSLSPSHSKRKLLQHPFPSRKYMHRLPIHGELLFLIQRNNVAF